MNFPGVQKKSLKIFKAEYELTRAIRVWKRPGISSYSALSFLGGFMAKTLKLCCEKLGYIKVHQIVLFSESEALLLYSHEGEYNNDVLAWQYFNPENGELIEAENGL